MLSSGEVMSVLAVRLSMLVLYSTAIACANSIECPHMKPLNHLRRQSIGGKSLDTGRRRSVFRCTAASSDNWRQGRPAAWRDRQTRDRADAYVPFLISKVAEDHSTQGTAYPTETCTRLLVSATFGLAKPSETISQIGIVTCLRCTKSLQPS